MRMECSSDVRFTRILPAQGLVNDIARKLPSFQAFELHEISNNFVRNFGQWKRFAQAEFRVKGRAKTFNSLTEASTNGALRRSFNSFIFISNVIGNALISSHGAINKALNVANAENSILAFRVFIIDCTMRDELFGRESFDCPGVTGGYRND